MGDSFTRKSAPLTGCKNLSRYSLSPSTFKARASRRLFLFVSPLAGEQIGIFNLSIKLLPKPWSSPPPPTLQSTSRSSHLEWLAFLRRSGESLSEGKCCTAGRYLRLLPRPARWCPGFDTTGPVQNKENMSAHVNKPYDLSADRYAHSHQKVHELLLEADAKKM
jgi:hypothetical protein